MAAALGLALALLAALRAGNAALNLRELSEMAYGLEILREPVLAGQVPLRGQRGARQGEAGQVRQGGVRRGDVGRGGLR